MMHGRAAVCLLDGCDRSGDRRTRGVRGPGTRRRERGRKRRRRRVVPEQEHVLAGKGARRNRRRAIDDLEPVSAGDIGG